MVLTPPPGPLSLCNCLVGMSASKKSLPHTPPAAKADTYLLSLPPYPRETPPAIPKYQSSHINYPPLCTHLNFSTTPGHSLSPPLHRHHTLSLSTLPHPSLYSVQHHSSSPTTLLRPPSPSSIYHQTPSQPFFQISFQSVLYPYPQPNTHPFSLENLL